MLLGAGPLQGLGLLESLCQERFSLGAAGKDRRGSVRVSKRMAFPAVLLTARGLRRLHLFKGSSFAGVTLSSVGKW